MKKKNLLPFNIQFFAEGDAGGESSEKPGADGGEGSGSGTGEGSNGGEGSGSGSAEKTFTQDQVTQMMAREKRQGRSAALKDLGFKSEKEAKDAIKLLNVLLDSQKTPEDKASEKAKGALDEKEAAERRATAAENKLSCLMAGVNNDSIDDALAIALLKVTEEKNLDKVLSEMKKEKKYASFFGGGSEGGEGTGSTPGHSKGGSGSNSPSAGDYGKRLAESYTPAKAQKKSSFFMED